MTHSRRVMRRIGIVAAAGMVLLTGSSTWLLGQNPVVPATQSPTVAPSARTADEVMGRAVTLHLENVTLDDALRALAKAANTIISYSVDAIPADKRVTLVADKISLRDAFDVLLRDVPVEPVVFSRQEVLLRPAKVREALGSAGTQQGTATISGYVRDSATGTAVPGADVRIDGTTLATKSASDGRYQISGMAAGQYRITARRVGYIASIRTVTLVDGQSKMIDFGLNPPATRLDEVVTTALGEQRRYEVGNSIATINVDSIAPTAPVMSITDLISARAPGVSVIESNGIVGSGESIRIRGISSLELQSDPVIIVDGVREDNTPGGAVNAAGMLNTDHLTPARLNDLDFNQIETINILKGPTATTEYGTDAANGVIVITTKRGASGSPLWDVDAMAGANAVPEKGVAKYYGWGHLTDGSGTPVSCTLTTIYGSPASTLGGCVVDSVTEFNPLNNRSTTMYGQGSNQAYHLSVSGGTDAVRYYLAGNLTNDNGIIRMPPIFRALVDTAGIILPDAAYRSNSEQQRSARLNTSMKLNASADVNASVALLSTSTLTPQSSSLLQGVDLSPAVDNAANWFGYSSDPNSPDPSVTPFANLRDLAWTNTTRVTGATTANWYPAGWLVGHASFGIDHGTGAQQTIIYPTGTNSVYSRTTGTIDLGNSSTDVYSADIRGSATAAISSLVKSVTSVGLQLAETKGASHDGTGDVTLANLSLNGCYPTCYDANETNQAATLGGYTEEQISLSDRLFLIGAVRIDAASGFGNAYAVAAYPKASFSWLALRGAQTTVRLRGAFGAAGQQPENGASQMLHAIATVYSGGTATSGSQISWPGNANLRPERSQEFEIGADLQTWQGRLSLEVTGYRKTTSDALVRVQLGGDIGSFPYEENIGDVQNGGVEANATASLLESRTVDWTVTVGGSVNSNKLVTLAPGAETNSYNFSVTQNHVGYPLYGLWVDPVSYTDVNHDGIIEADEVSFPVPNGDNQYGAGIYRGTSAPTREMSVSTHLGLWHGMVSIGGLVDARGGYRVYNGVDFFMNQAGSTPQQNFPTAPQWEQATTGSNISGATGLAPGSFVQDGTMIRFRELSLTYTIPRRVTSKFSLVQNVSLTAAVRNLALWTRYLGVDPEVSGGYGGAATDNTPVGYQVVNNDVRADWGTVPLLRTWMFKLNVGLR